MSFGVPLPQCQVSGHDPQVLVNLPLSALNLLIPRNPVTILTQLWWRYFLDLLELLWELNSRHKNSLPLSKMMGLRRGIYPYVLLDSSFVTFWFSFECWTWWTRGVFFCLSWIFSVKADASFFQTVCKLPRSFATSTFWKYLELSHHFELQMYVDFKVLKTHRPIVHL